MLPAIGGALHDQAGVLALEREIGRDGLLELPLGALDPHEAGLDLDVDAVRDGNWKTTDAAHYQMCARTSPPTRWSRAWYAVITPLEVVRIAVPIPPWTLGS